MQYVCTGMRLFRLGSRLIMMSMDGRRTQRLSFSGDICKLSTSLMPTKRGDCFELLGIEVGAVDPRLRSCIRRFSIECDDDCFHMPLLSCKSRGARMVSITSVEFVVVVNSLVIEWVCAVVYVSLKCTTFLEWICTLS